MKKRNDLETTTVITFRDMNKEFARSYKGLLDFREGDEINLVKTSKDMPVSPGDYIVRKGSIYNQMGLSLDNDFESDSIYRYYYCDKL